MNARTNQETSMGHDGPQRDCPMCGWSYFKARKRCRNCGEDIAVVEITTNGTTRFVPADEPVFLIRGQDVVGSKAVRAWADLAEEAGADEAIVSAAREHANKMDAWTTKKVADLPAPADAATS